jgi:peptidoglycan/xylan/chitin deacetylase (PgdA/CDA1 family)
MNGAVPVITYHSVGRVISDWAWRELTTPVEVFEDHLRALSRAGYRTATLTELADHVEGIRPLEGRRVVLTFDDGYLDNWSHAAPVLERHGFTGTVLVTAEFVEPTDAVRPQRAAGAARNSDVVHDVRAFMSWEELRRAARSGVLDVHSHAMTHTWYPVSGEVVDFHHPGDAHYWLDWNSDPASKPYYLKNLGASRVPWGVPVYAHAKSLCCRRYFPDAAESEHMAAFVDARAGTAFFADPSWRDVLTAELARFRAGRADAGRLESDAERDARLEWEIAESRRIIGEETGREVSFLVWPGGGYDATSMSIARRHYRAVTISGPDRWRHHNRPGENPGMIVRRGAPTIVVGPREFFAPGNYLVDAVEEFRGSKLARRRRQARKLALLAAARLGRWPAAS